MTTVRPFNVWDLVRFNSVNLDKLTETYNMGFYLQYLAQWPELFSVTEAPDGEIMGYIMGKVEGKRDKWHGHVTAVTVGPCFRRLGLMRTMMEFLEEVSDKVHKGYFVDLFVRVSNVVAINAYKNFGYETYRKVLGYYSGIEDSEDALDMRKSLTRDPGKKTMVPLGRDIFPSELDATL